MKRHILIFSALISCFPRNLCAFPEYISSDVFHVDTSGPLATTIAYPMFKNRMYFGVHQTELGHDHCPVITFTNSPQNRTAEPTINIYFCNDFFGIFNGWDGIYGLPYNGPDDDEYRGIWINIDQHLGELTIGLRESVEPLHSFKFTKKDSSIQKFFSHFALGGFGSWIVEKKSTFVVGESASDECSTSYFPIQGNRIDFGIRTTAPPTEKCPRIQFHTSPRTNEKPYLAIYFCKDSYSFRYKNQILEGKNVSLLTDDELRAYWVRLDQHHSTISIGNSWNYTAFYTFDYSGFFMGFFFSHFTFVGHVHVYFRTDGQDLHGML